MSTMRRDLMFSGAVGVALILLMVLGPRLSAYRQQQAAIAEATEIRTRVDANHADLRKQLFSQREAIETSARSASDSGDYVRAVQVIEPWLPVADAELHAIYNVALQLRDAEAKLSSERAAEEEAQREGMRADIERTRDAEENEITKRIGRKPVRSGWDGSYSEVVSYLEAAANDPDSIEIIGCTPVYDTPQGWVTACDFRGKNSFGALVKQRTMFTILFGKVTSAKDG